MLKKFILSGSCLIANTNAIDINCAQGVPSLQEMAFPIAFKQTFNEFWSQNYFPFDSAKEIYDTMIQYYNEIVKIKNNINFDKNNPRYILLQREIQKWIKNSPYNFKYLAFVDLAFLRFNGLIVTDNIQSIKKEYIENLDVKSAMERLKSQEGKNELELKIIYGILYQNFVKGFISRNDNAAQDSKISAYPDAQDNYYINAYHFTRFNGNYSEKIALITSIAPTSISAVNVLALFGFIGTMIIENPILDRKNDIPVNILGPKSDDYKSLYRALFKRHNLDYDRIIKQS